MGQVSQLSDAPSSPTEGLSVKQHYCWCVNSRCQEKYKHMMINSCYKCKHEKLFAVSSSNNAPMPCILQNNWVLFSNICLYVYACSICPPPPKQSADRHYKVWYSLHIPVYKWMQQECRHQQWQQMQKTDGEAAEQRRKQKYTQCRLATLRANKVQV